MNILVIYSKSSILTLSLSRASNASESDEMRDRPGASLAAQNWSELMDLITKLERSSLGQV